MKISRLLLFSLILILAGALSACAGGTSAATSWPGLTVDSTNGLAYLSYNQQVYAIDSSNGSEKWRYPETASAKITFYAPPALTQNGQLIVGSYDHNLYSVNSQDGKPTQGTSWPFTDGSNISRYIAGPLIVGDQVFAPNEDNVLYALDVNGKQTWTYKTDQALWATPASDGTTIYLPSMDHHVYALDAKSGQLVWESEDLGGAVAGTPAIGPDGELYVGTFKSEMLAVNSKTGKVDWRFSTNGWVYSGPALANGVLYFGDLNGYFYALKTADHSELWPAKAPAASTNNGISGTPLVDQGIVYYTSEDGNIYALDATTGNSRWNQTIGGKLYAPPILAGDKILVSSVGGDNLLYALNLQGSEAWKYNPQSK